MSIKSPVISFVIFLPMFLAAQTGSNSYISPKRCLFQTLNIEQGLKNNSANQVVTDGQGFTWFSTYTGFQRYNGKVFENINPVIGKDTIVINNTVRFLKLQNGQLWIACKYGIISYDPFTNIFTWVEKIPKLVNRQIFYPIIPIQEVKEGIWCSQFQTGIVLYNRTGKIIRLIKGTSVFTDSLSYAEGMNNLTSNNNYIFLTKGDNHIHAINIVDQSWQVLNFNFNSIASFACSRNKLFISTNNSLVCVEIPSFQLIGNLPYTKLTKEKSGFSTTEITNYGKLLLGINSHVFELDSNFKNTTELLSVNGSPIVSTGFVRMIYSDAYKRIWVVTYDDIKRLEDFNLPFKHFIFPDEKNNFVRSLYYDESKHLLIAGGYRNSVQVYDSSGKAIWEIPASAKYSGSYIIGIEKLTKDKYLCIEINNPKGNEWLLLDLAKRQLIPYPIRLPPELGYHSDYYNNLQRLNDSTIIISNVQNLYRCVFKENKPVNIKPLLPKNNYGIGTFTQTHDGAIWVGTSFGEIQKLDPKNKLSQIPLPENHIIRYIQENKDGNIWVGTDQGIFIYSPNGMFIRAININTGLRNDCIYAMLPDGKGGIFASTNLGISYINPKGTIKNYPKEVGLQENEYNSGAAVKTKNGRLFFGGVNGITAFYLNDLTSSFNSDTPSINLIKVIVNDLPFQSPNGIFSGDSILLDYNQNRLQLDIGAIGLPNINEYNYLYRMDGFEKNWQSTTSPFGIKYNLLPGTYHLELKYSPFLSSSSNFYKKILIVIKPPYWQTWWFRLILGISIASIFAFIIWQYNNRRLKKKIQEFQLQQEIQQNLQKERERISRDLHDNLGAYAAAIAANVNTIQEKSEPTVFTALNELQQNSQSIVTQLSDTIWALNREEIALTAISDRFKVFIQKIQPSYPQINISVQETVTTDLTLSPTNALHLFRILQEAVNNAVKHSGCSNIVIHIEGGRTWSVSIADDGTGMGEMKSIYGNGIRNMRQRAREAGWGIEWKKREPTGTILKISSLSNIN